VKGGGKKRGRRAGRQVWVGSSVELDGEVSVLFIFGDDVGIRDRGSAGKSKENDRE
jgi:hypothetical protein